MWNQAVVSVAEHPVDRLAFLLGFHAPEHCVHGADIGIALGHDAVEGGGDGVVVGRE